MEAQKEPAKKKPYHPPELITYGDLTFLTEAGMAAGMIDGAKLDMT